VLFKKVPYIVLIPSNYLANYTQEQVWEQVPKNCLKMWVPRLKNRLRISRTRCSQQQDIFLQVVQLTQQESWLSIGFIRYRFLLICQIRNSQFNIHFGMVFLFGKYLRTLSQNSLRTKCFEPKTVKSLFTIYFMIFGLTCLEYFWNSFADYLVQKGIFLAMRILWRISRLFSF